MVSKHRLKSPTYSACPELTSWEPDTLGEPVRAPARCDQRLVESLLAPAQFTCLSGAMRLLNAAPSDLRHPRSRFWMAASVNPPLGVWKNVGLTRFHC